MIRIAIRAWVLCFTSLTILPGCQILSPFGGGSSNVAKDDRTHLQPVEKDKQAPEASSQSKSIATSNTDPRARPMDAVRLENVDKLPVKVDSAPPVQPTELVIGVETVGAKGPQAPGTLPKALEQKPEKREFAPLVLALQCILDGRHAEGIEHLNVYDKRTQEFLIGLLPIMDIFVRKGLDEMSAPEVAVLNSQLISLLTALRPRSELMIDKMCYCKNVRGFGAYDVLPGNHVFLSATNDRPGELVQLYVELKNFASEASKDGEFITKLNCSLELHDAKGEKVWSHAYDRKDTTHLRRTRLNDFFHAYRFDVPKVAPGDYKLTIRIADETVPGLNRDVSKSLSFRVTPVLNQTTLR